MHLDFILQLLLEELSLTVPYEHSSFPLVGPRDSNAVAALKSNRKTCIDCKSKLIGGVIVILVHTHEESPRTDGQVHKNTYAFRLRFHDINLSRHRVRDHIRDLMHNWRKFVDTHIVPGQQMQVDTLENGS